MIQRAGRSVVCALALRESASPARSRRERTDGRVRNLGFVFFPFRLCYLSSSTTTERAGCVTVSLPFSTRAPVNATGFTTSGRSNEL